MGKSYKDKYKRNNNCDKHNKRNKQNKSKFKFETEVFNPKKVAYWDDDQNN